MPFYSFFILFCFLVFLPFYLAFLILHFNLAKPVTTEKLSEGKNNMQLKPPTRQSIT
jgi:phosphotransferase system  glucose/maltose/N-acetylglucosamine-specific IIC component